LLCLPYFEILLCGLQAGVDQVHVWLGMIGATVRKLESDPNFSFNFSYDPNFS